MRAALGLVLLALAAPPASAQTVAFYLEARDDGFRVPGYDEASPTLAVEAGSEVAVTVANNGTKPHNLVVGAPVSAATPCCLLPGESATLSFRLAPNATGEVAYWSQGAPDARGAFRVGPPLPRIRIVEPDDGADVGSAFTARVAVSSFVLEPFPSRDPPLAGHGHLRFLVDGGNATPYTHETTRAFMDLPPGHHLLRAELVGRDGRPLDPPAFHEVLVYRRADPTPPPPTPDGPVGTPPDDGSRIPAPGVALALAAAAIASRSRRPR